MIKDLTHDVVNLLAYYYDCQDKCEKYECQYCVDDEEAERYACPDPEDCGCDDCEMARADYSSDEDYSYDDDNDDEEDDDEDPDERRERKKRERKREKAYKKRNQRDHMKHLSDEHNKKLRIFLNFKQDLIPLCDSSFWGNCEFGLDDIFRCMVLNKGHKFLNMEEPPRPESPRSPKAWQYMMGMENEDYE